MIDYGIHENEDGIWVIRVAGELTGESNPYFFNCIQDDMESGKTHIVINFSDVGYINSAGLGMLVRARARINKADGLVYLACINNKLIEIFSVINFEKIFDIYPTEEDAIEAMRRKLGKT